MQAVRARLAAFAAADHGGVAIEYGLVLSLITLGILAATISIGQELIGFFVGMATGLQR